MDTRTHGAITRDENEAAGADKVDLKALLVSVRRQLDRVCAARLHRPLNPAEQESYDELCRTEAALLHLTQGAR